MNGRTRVGCGVAAAVALALPGMGSASAAQSNQAFDCSDGSSIVVQVPGSHSSDHGGWAVGQVVDGGSGHLIPTSFTFALDDLTTGTEVFAGTQVKGGSNGNHTQSTVTCSSIVFTTAGEFFGPELPPGISASDSVTFTITVVAVPKR